MEETPQDPTHPDKSSIQSKRRAWLLAGAGAFVAVAAVLGIAYLRHRSQSLDVELPELNETALAPPSGPIPESLVRVREHPRNQACGPGWSERKSIVVPPHERRLRNGREPDPG